MNNYNKETYYEQPEFWVDNLSNNLDEKLRLDETLKMIPDNMQTILDVGCGNGFLTNVLAKSNYERLVGFDCSNEALKHLNTETILGNISSLPFEDKSFDLVTCLETIEHLTEDDYLKGITEIQRVAKKYIIISVPNEEVLENSLVSCPKCCCCFNPDFHMRSYDIKKIKSLFRDFTVVKSKEIGPERKMHSYPSFLAMFRFYYLSWLTYAPYSSTYICPQCNFQLRDRIIIKGIDKRIKYMIWKIIYHFFNVFGKIFYSKKKKCWIIALYKRNGK